MNATSHTLHLLLYLAGATAQGFARPTRVRGEFYRAKPIEGDDTVCLRAETDTGVTIGFLDDPCLPPPQLDRVQVEGETGTLVLTATGLRIERPEREPEVIELPATSEGGHYGICTR